MTKTAASLYVKFQPENYTLELTPSKNPRFCNVKLVIKGRKTGRPSKRITLHQKGLRIITAKLIRYDKQGPRQQEVSRINHLPTFEEVRIHSKEMLYPGAYEISLSYNLEPGSIKALKLRAPKTSWRELLPSIDEAEAWNAATIEIKQ